MLLWQIKSNLVSQNSTGMFSDSSRTQKCKVGFFGLMSKHRQNGIPSRHQNWNCCLSCSSVLRLPHILDSCSFFYSKIYLVLTCRISYNSFWLYPPSLMHNCNVFKLFSKSNLSFYPFPIRTLIMTLGPHTQPKSISHVSIPNSVTSWMI